jgi:hypothetical protein
MASSHSFTTLAPYINGSETSKAAAVDIGKHRETLRQKVLAYITLYGPVSDEMIQRALGMNPSTQRPRRIELVEAGKVKDSGQKRKTLSGRTAIAWEVA